jgi:protein arginine kinase activator
VICQRCGVLEATVHFSDPGDNPRRFQWLCSKCADMIVSSLVGQASDSPSEPEDPAPKAWDPTDINSQVANSKNELLGRMFSLADDGEVPEDKACSQCGMYLKKFRQAGLLGCPQCYVEFRDVLRPFLSRLHGHTSHLGRTPGQADGSLSPHVQIMRLRVDLEKAIATEDFENAANLRDEIEKLKATPSDINSRENGGV